MKPAILNILILINLALAGYLMAQQQRAKPAPATNTLRVRALELVDDAGRVRAELKVFPAQPDLKMPDGTTGYPETVLFRLISSQGAPYIKIGASEDGGGINVGGEDSYIQTLARGTNPFVKILRKDGREQVIKP